MEKFTSLAIATPDERSSFLGESKRANGGGFWFVLTPYFVLVFCFGFVFVVSFCLAFKGTQRRSKATDIQPLRMPRAGVAAAVASLAVHLAAPREDRREGARSLTVGEAQLNEHGRTCRE